MDCSLDNLAMSSVSHCVMCIAQPFVFACQSQTGFVCTLSNTSSVNGGFPTMCRGRWCGRVTLVSHHTRTLKHTPTDTHTHTTHTHQQTDWSHMPDSLSQALKWRKSESFVLPGATRLVPLFLLLSLFCPSLFGLSLSDSLPPVSLFYLLSPFPMLPL